MSQIKRKTTFASRKSKPSMINIRWIHQPIKSVPNSNHPMIQKSTTEMTQHKLDVDGGFVVDTVLYFLKIDKTNNNRYLKLPFRSQLFNFLKNIWYMLLMKESVILKKTNNNTTLIFLLSNWPMVLNGFYDCPVKNCLLTISVCDYYAIGSSSVVYVFPNFISTLWLCSTY